MIYIKKLYAWVLGWSDSSWGSTALFFIAFVEASFFPIPPDVLLIALALGSRSKALKFAILCSAGSALGAIFGYSIGYFLWWNSSGDFSNLALFFFDTVPSFSVELFYSIKEKYNLWNFWIVFISGFTPIPFKVFTISAGAFSINFTMFFIASIISRSARFLILALLIKKFGDPIKGFIDKYFNILAIAFTVILVGSFFLIKFLF